MMIFCPVAADAAAGWIDDSLAASLKECHELGNSQWLFIQGAIVEADERIHPQLADNSEMHRVLGKVLPLWLDALVPPTSAVVQNISRGSVTPV